MINLRKLKVIVIAFFCCLAILFSPTSTVFAEGDGGADDLNSLGGVTSSGSLIQVVVGTQLSIVYFHIIHPSVDATETTDSHIKVAFDVIGAGDMKIVDQGSNVLWTGSRTDTAQGHYEVDLSLPAVGDYELTLGFENTVHTLSDNLSLSIKYKAIIPDVPGMPNTGHIYIGGRAISTSSVLLPTVVVAGIWWFVVWYRRKSGDKRKTVF